MDRSKKSSRLSKKHRHCPLKEALGRSEKPFRPLEEVLVVATGVALPALPPCRVEVGTLLARVAMGTERS